MARVTYLPNHSDEVLDIDPATHEPVVITLGPADDSWMTMLVAVGFAVLAVIVVIVIGLGFMDLAFGTT